MKVIAFNGSPRKEWNTATLLRHALQGAAAQGAETELIHLYDLRYPGCTSCFACKRKGSRYHARCAVQDALTQPLAQAMEAQAILIGAPIYIGAVSGMMQAFLERLIFPSIAYDSAHSTLAPHPIRTAGIYTFGADEVHVKQMGFEQPINVHARVLARVFGSFESLLVTDTYQFDDYAKYEASGMDVAQKTQRRQEVFPQDCQKAFELGARLCQPAG
jgi:multimeric flavodoxin WrbA